MFGGPNLSNFKFLEDKNMSDAGLKTPYGHRDFKIGWTGIQI